MATPIPLHRGPSSSAAAFANRHLFSLYLEYRKDTEAPIQFHRWSLLTSVGAFLGRSYWFPFGSERIFPNLYVMLIGNPGTRKSTAIKGAKKVLSHAGYETFSAERTTKEKFLLDLEGLPESFGERDSYDSRTNGKRSRAGSGRSEVLTAEDVLRNLDLSSNKDSHDGVPRECFIVADEFTQFAGAGNLDFLSLLGVLWDWDDETKSWDHRLKNSKSIAIYQPTISILGGNTHTGFQEAFPVQSIGQGFMSRLILIHGEPSGRKITFPSAPPEDLGEAIKEHFGRIKEKVSGPAKLTGQAERALDVIYRTWQELEDYRFKHYSTRRFTHLLKLVLICSAMRCTTTIDIEDVLLANTLLSHAESTMSKALGEFGKSRNSEATQAVMTALYEANKPLTFEDLYKVVRRDIDKREQLTDILHGLLEAGKIQPPPKNNPTKGFLPLQKPVNSNAMYVDFKLLEKP